MCAFGYHLCAVCAGFSELVDVFSGFFLCYGILVARNEAGFLRCGSVGSFCLLCIFFELDIVFVLIFQFFQQFFTNSIFFK